MLRLVHSSKKGFYPPVSGVNASTIRPFSIIIRYVWYRETSFVAIQVLIWLICCAFFIAITNSKAVQSYTIEFSFRREHI